MLPSSVLTSRNRTVNPRLMNWCSFGHQYSRKREGGKGPNAGKHESSTPRTWERKENRFCLEMPERNTALWILDFSPLRPVPAFQQAGLLDDKSVASDTKSIAGYYSDPKKPAHTEGSALGALCLILVSFDVPLHFVLIGPQLQTGSIGSVASLLHILQSFIAYPGKRMFMKNVL